MAYPIFTLLMAAWVHPVAVHWVWTKGSWLLSINDECRFLDFAGGTVVHICGERGASQERYTLACE